MATREKIEFDFRQAMRQADRIEEIADKLNRLSSSKLESSLQNLSVSWKGENASAYLAKGERLQGKMGQTAKGLQAAASDIRTVAKRLYDAEMAALAIASARTY